MKLVFVGSKTSEIILVLVLSWLMINMSCITLWWHSSLLARPGGGVVAGHVGPLSASAGASSTSPTSLGGDELLGLDVLQAGPGLVIVGGLVSELGRVAASQLLLHQPRGHRAGQTEAGLAGARAGAELLLTGV